MIRLTVSIDGNPEENLFGPVQELYLSFLIFSLSSRFYRLDQINRLDDYLLLESSLIKLWLLNEGNTVRTVIYQW